jgi:hypothetical protein
VPSPAGLELRVDGVLTSLGANGLDWGAGGRVSLIGQGTLEIDFPEGTTLLVTPHWWSAHNQWYLTVAVFHTAATLGLMGDIAPRSWLESGFADRWRVTPSTSLFDYASGASTATFTFPAFPSANVPPLKPENIALAQNACGRLKESVASKNCEFDVATTGDDIFAQTALQDRELRLGATQITVNTNKLSSKFGEIVTLTAFVVKHKAGQGLPKGTAQFFVDGKEVSGPIRLNERGQARWSGALLESGKHLVQARFYPDSGSALIASSSAGLTLTVDGSADDPRGGL